MHPSTDWGENRELTAGKACKGGILVNSICQGHLDGNYHMGFMKWMDVLVLSILGKGYAHN